MPVRLGPPCRRPILNATMASLYARRYTSRSKAIAGNSAIFFGTKARCSRTISKLRPGRGPHLRGDRFYGGVVSSKLPMLTVRSEIGPYRPSSALPRVAKNNVCARMKRPGSMETDNTAAVRILFISVFILDFQYFAFNFNRMIRIP
jgi:hypothetical protein